jgi:phosphatidylserine/phosphatidylglycerophosphate/cardiolipin synthase-like enzyme
MRNRLGKGALLALSVGVIATAVTTARSDLVDGLLGGRTGSRSTAPRMIAASGTVEVAFSPDGGATEVVVKAINEARERILVQAFSFTSRDIADALVAAKRRGVEVLAILDKTNQTDKYTSATFLQHHGIPVRIDDQHAIAHNKVMVIDGEDVITGSMNFTRAAETKNAENVLVMRGNPGLNHLYAANWEAHWAHSFAYVQ